MKVGIIGPTNILKFSAILEKPKGFLLNQARLVGQIVAKANGELWVNSDQGMLVGVCRGYKEGGGKRVVILHPQLGEPWPKMHAIPYLSTASEVRLEKNWFWSNYNVVTLPDLCVCVGLSAGTFSELAYIKWNNQFGIGNLKKLIGVRSLLREKRFPPEIEAEVGGLIEYIEAAEDLGTLL